MSRKYLTPIVVPSVFLSNGSNLNAALLAGKLTLQLMASSGKIDYLQSSLARKKFWIVNPAGKNNTNFSVLGLAAVAIAGTATTRQITATNMFTRTRRGGAVSAATAGSACGVRYGDTMVYLGNGAGLGGFFKCTRFGCSDAATVAGARQFVGIIGLIATPTDVEPSTLVNCVGVGNGAADTNLKLYYGGSSAQTPIDLGANFPANTLSADLYELIIFSPADALGVVYVRVERLNTGDVFETTLSSTSTVVLPSTTLLNPIYMYRSNGSTALAVGLDLISEYGDSEF